MVIHGILAMEKFGIMEIMKIMMEGNLVQVILLMYGWI